MRQHEHAALVLLMAILGAGALLSMLGRVVGDIQPAIMAIMLEQLEMEPGHRVLEIGAGTGYNAALMAHIVGDAGQVVTVDIDEDIAEGAREHLVAAGFGQVQVVCGFMRLRGAFAGPDSGVQLGPDPGLYLLVDDRNRVDAEVTYQLLAGPSQDWPTPVQVTPGEVWGGLNLWLALREPGFCWLSAEGEGVERGVVPYLFGHSGAFCSAVGLIGEAGLCGLMRPPDQSPPVEQPVEQPDEPQPFELFPRSFGPDETLAHRLLDQVAGWDAAGRPSIKGLRLRSYPPAGDYVPSASEFVIQKQWSRLVLDWR